MDLKEEIIKLNLDSSIRDILIANNILVIYDLWILDRSKLKKLGLKDSQINNIIIKLELNGIGLNKKVYKSSIR